MEFIEMIKQQLVLPLIVTFIGGLVYFGKKYMDQISRSILAKNEMTVLEKESQLRNQVLQTISESTKSAVAYNMETANSIKAEGRYLTEDEITELNESAMNIVLNSLPPSLTEEDGVLLKLIGNKEKLIALIKSYMEKYVYEYKMKNNQIISLPTNTLINEEYVAPLNTENKIEG